MKKLPLYIAALLLAVSCGPMMPGSQGSDEPVSYFIDDESFTGDISNEFIYRMLDMAYAGHKVQFGNKTNSRSAGHSQTVNYSTSEREDAFRWARRMSSRGFTITVSYNKKLSKYFCVATREA